MDCRSGDAVNHTVVYTAIIGGYDRLLASEPCSDSDFVCFTDNPGAVPAPWKAEPIEFFRNDTLTNRKYKILAHKFFPTYERSVYIDASVRLRCRAADMLDQELQDSNMALVRHPLRKCIYREARACVKGRFDSPRIIRAQMSRYRKEGYPENYGLVANTVLLRRHMSDDIIEAMELWWGEVTSGSWRDQLSFCYVAWRLGLKFSTIDVSLRDNKYFRWGRHIKKRKRR